MPVYAIPVEMVINKGGILFLYSQLLELLWWVVDLLQPFKLNLSAIGSTVA